MKIWDKSEQRTHAKALIDWLISERGDGGWLINWSSMVAWKELAYLVSQDGKQDAVPPGELMALIGQTAEAEAEENTLEAFEAIYYKWRQEQRRVQAKGNREWTFLLPIHARVEQAEDDPFELRLLDQDFQLLPKSVALEKAGSSLPLDDTDYLLRNTGYVYDTPPVSYILTSGRGLARESAWEMVAPAFDTLRGLIELTWNLHRWRMQWNRTGKQKPRRTVAHPLWMICLSEEVEPTFVTFITDEEVEAEISQLEPKAMEVLKRNAVLLRKEPNVRSVQSLIAASLRLYANAMDARSNRLALLAFWQLAESITMYEPTSGKTTDVVNRLAWHASSYGLTGSGYRATLSAISQKRNRFVHEGIDLVDDGDIDILKLACENALLWLIRIADNLPSKSHLRHFYQFRTLSNADLEAIRSVAHFALSNRTGSS